MDKSKVKWIVLLLIVSIVCICFFELAGTMDIINIGSGFDIKFDFWGLKLEF